jgi:hypothetical protein
MSKESRTKALYLIMAVIIISSTVIAAANLSFDQQPQPTQSGRPTDTPDPNAPVSTATPFTFPTPQATPVLISFGPRIHKTGMFFIANLEEWNDSENAESNRAMISYIDNARFAVVHAFVDAGLQPLDLNYVKTYYDTATFDSAWNNYDSWNQVERGELEGDAIRDVFELALGGMTYHAVQYAFPYQNWLFTLRIVVPENNPALLQALEDKMYPSLRPNPDAVGLDFRWPAHAVKDQGYLFKYPESWRAAGMTASRLTDPNDHVLMTVDAEDFTRAKVTGDDVTAAIVERLPDAEIAEIEPVERAHAQGFRADFAYRDPDGAERQGTLMMLAGGGRRYIVDLRLSSATLDPLDAEAERAAADAEEVLRSFSVLSPDIFESIPTGTPDTSEVTIEAPPPSPED